MASSELRANPRRRAALAVTGGDDTGALPVAALSEILVRFPSKILCRLRAVCRAWRSLLSDPGFIAAHAARNSEPYLVAWYPEDADSDSLVDVLDLSGRIVKQVKGEGSDKVVMRMSSDLVCVKTIETGVFRLVNPVSGAVYRLSNELAAEHAALGFRLRDYGEPVHLVGKVAGTGEHKVLRMLPYHCLNGNRQNLFEVCTLSSSSSSTEEWRGKQGPPAPILWNEWTRVAIGGVVYFLTVAAYFAVMNLQVIEQDWILQFDLEAEEWRASTARPDGIVAAADDNDDFLCFFQNLSSKQVRLANVSGSLAFVFWSSQYMDLWFLMDSAKGPWVKQYHVHVEQPDLCLPPMHSLVALEDGSIVTVMRSKGLFQLYDLRTNRLLRTMMLNRDATGVSLCTGSLLGLNHET